jgi:hypothetical protein
MEASLHIAEEPEAKRREQPAQSEEASLLPSLQCVTPVLLRDWVMGIGPFHVISYKESGNKVSCMAAWEYDTDDDSMCITNKVILKGSVHFDDGPLPIVEVTDTHVFRADFNGTIYIWSLYTGDLVYHAACCKQEGDMVAVYKPRVATHTSYVIVTVSSPREDLTVVGVCMNWRGGNKEFLFFDSAIPLITSITAIFPTQFLLTSAIGLCSLILAVPDVKTWALLPYTRVNHHFFDEEDDIQLVRELVPVSRFHSQLVQWRDSFMKDEAIEDSSSVTEAVRLLKCRNLPKEFVPHHVRKQDDIIYMVSDAYLVRINETTRDMRLFKNEARSQSIACIGVDGVMLSVTADGDIYMHADDKFSVTPATAFTAKGRGLYQVEVRPSSPNNGILQRFGKYVYVNIYQKHVFPFFLEKKDQVVGDAGLEMEFDPAISMSPE